MNGENVIWTAGEMDSFVDVFRSPMPSRDFYVRDGIIEGWPSFHASQADPDGGYQAHRYRVFFRMEKSEDVVLYLKLIASTPRLGYLRIVVNGKEGLYYPYPVPSDDRQIKPSHALHAAIYSKEEIRILLPGTLFSAGENVLEVEAADDGEVLRVENEQAVLRLDRMADACGFHYGAFRLERPSEADDLKSEILIRPLVLYRQFDGVLKERCLLVIRNMEKGGGQGRLHLSWEGGELQINVHWEGGAFGQAQVPFWLPDGEGTVRYRLEGDRRGAGTFERRRKWTVYTMPHAHTDIGYTHRQWEVAERMCRNLDQAMNLLRKNEEHFSYIIDGTWHLEEYGRTRSAEKQEELREWVRRGKIGIPWNYADLLTQFPTLEALIHNGDYAAEYLEGLGMVPERADIVDVASASSSYPSVLAGSGVKYLIHADNQDRGPFRFNGNLHRKSPFWWEGPDGGRVLVWLAKMYCELKKVCGSPMSPEAAAAGLEMWLQEYEREDYPADAVMLYGMEADNTDIDVRAPGFYERWEETAAYPRLIPSDGCSFFRYMEQYGDRLWHFKGDEGAYWEDGMCSSAKESFAMRHTESGIRSAEVLDALAVIHCPNLSFPEAEYREAWRQVLLYDEHTWGAFLSGSDPESQLQADQWSCKEGMARQAGLLQEKLLTQALAKLSLMWNNGGREIVVYNPFSFPVNRPVTVEIGAGEIPVRESGETIFDVVSRTATQKVIRMDTGQMEPFSYRRWRLVAGDETKGKTKMPEEPSWREAAGESVVLENEWYRVCVDTEAGALTSWCEKESGREYADSGRGMIGRLLYAEGGEGTTLLGNRDELSREGVQAHPCFLGRKYRLHAERCGQRLEITGHTGRGPCSIQIELPVKRKEIKISFHYEKAPFEGLEALYVEFPLRIGRESRILSDSQIGWTDWREGCLPGACREWLPLQTSILLQAEDCEIQIVSPEAFLFTAGDTVQGTWDSGQELDASHIYSYVLNNYWRVNYQGIQGGPLDFTYTLRAEKKISFSEAYRLGQQCRGIIPAVRMSYQEFREGVPGVFGGTEGRLLDWEGRHVEVSTIRGTGGGENEILIRLVETEGQDGEASLSVPGRDICEVWEADLPGRRQKKLERPEGSVHVKMRPWQVRTLLLVTKESLPNVPLS